MAGILEYDETPAANVAINGIGIQGTNKVLNFDNALRQMMGDAAKAVTRVVDKAAGVYTAIKADYNQLWRATGTATFNLTAAATLTAGWCLHVKADGGVVTIDPGGSEQINGASTLTVQVGSWAFIVCSGTDFRATVGGVPAQPQYVLAGGTADALTITPTIPVANYSTGDVITFTASADNTGAATVNVSGVGVKTIRKIVGGVDVALAPKDQLKGGRYALNYDAAANAGAGAWILVNKSTAEIQDAIDVIVERSTAPSISFRAYRSTNQSLPASGSYRIITFDAETWDEGSYYDTSTGRWTPPAGRYLVSGAALVSNPTTSTTIASGILKNGSPVAEQNGYASTSSNLGVPPVSTLVTMNGTDYLEFGVVLNSAAEAKTIIGDALGRYTYFWGHKV